MVVGGQAARPLMRLVVAKAGLPVQTGAFAASLGFQVSRQDNAARMSSRVAIKVIGSSGEGSKPTFS